MIRTVLSTLGLLIALTGCDLSPKPPSTAAPNSVLPAADRDAPRSLQKSDKPEVTAEKIMRDVVGRVVPISELTGQGPNTEWTFDPDEYKQVSILETRMVDDGLTIVIFMSTKNNPQPGEDAVQVSGKLQLHYRWRGGQWTLTQMDNLTFRYSIGLST